jgi:hypothetical protein
MDPITAAGFAAGILSFINFSYKVISGTSEMFKSGTTAENAHIGNVVNDLRKATEQLSIRRTGTSDNEKALNMLASECQELSDNLLKLLEKLRVTAENSKWKNAKVFLRSMWEKEKVAEMESRLTKYRSQILYRLVLILG